ncbi:hypothetical protein MKW94_003043 [Papaver nudicaule]|uniref:Uncharacterized protein n=1 Tax=Papaver nudicaule TaxID=74823 RepID=A0AA41VZA2_PAPNU|nr:hypothetical protein [Papaver nudicaule]MCL7050289.1 hypothetical protein [Papaver nudicaule]
MNHKRSIINGSGNGNGKKTLLFRINKRKKLPSIRLGGKKQKRGFNQQVVRLIKRMKLKWIKLQYLCMLKRLKSFYYSMLKDLMDANYTTYDSMQQRSIMESYFSVPVMGVSIVSVPSYIPNKYN